jgi:hypothetical protein
VLNGLGHGGEINPDLAAKQIGERRPPAAIGNVQHVDSRHTLEQLPEHMTGAADTA